MSATPWDLDELRRLEKEATPAGSPGRSCFYKPGDLVAMGVTKQNATFLVALRNAAAAGMLEWMAKLENVAKACDMRKYEAQQGSCAICNEPDCEDCPGNDIRVALGALDALRTKEPR